jgi:hypothetical protein
MDYSVRDKGNSICQKDAAVMYFTCSRCNKQHPAIRVDHGASWKFFSNTGPTARRQARLIMELRTRWEMAAAKLFSPAMEAFDKLNVPFEAMELDRPKNYKAIQLAEIEACAAYLASKRTDVIWLVPDTIVSVKRLGRSGTLQCAEDCKEVK